MLASVDDAHDTLSGPATRRILKREIELCKRPKYARLIALRSCSILIDEFRAALLLWSPNLKR